MVPPQERPARQAVSSATPNSSVFALPLSITSRASVTTAPSTHPPETEPRKLPWSSITRLEPTGRGAEPHVSTTVASATPRPARRQSSAAFRISSSRASMGASKSIVHQYGSLRFARQRQSISRHLAQPRLAFLRLDAALGQRAHQVTERIEVVHR